MRKSITSFMARFVYWTSLGFDMSEYPIAGIRQNERNEVLRKRIGDKAFREFKDGGWRYDPAFYASAAKIPVGAVVIAIIIISVMEYSR